MTPCCCCSTGAGCRGHRHAAGTQVLHAQGQGHGPRRVPHPQHARTARHGGPGAGALSHGRQRLQRGRGPALLRERPVRHRAGAQRQPHQCPVAAGRAVLHRPPPHQHGKRLRGAAQRVRARTRARHARRAAAGRGRLRRGGRRAPAREGLLCRDRADRGPWPAGLPRSARHPPAVHRPQRGRHGDGGQRIGGAGRHQPCVRARRAARRGRVHHARRHRARPPVRAGAAAQPLHLRVRLSRAARFRAGRHLRVPGAPQPGRGPGQARGVHGAAQRDRRDHPDPRIQPPERHAARAPARHSVPRGLREEPLRGPHLHHAGAGRAQEVRAPEAQRDRQRIQGPQRAAGGRLHRARHDLARDRADGPRRRRAQGVPRQRRAAGALSQRVRHRHAHQQ